MYRLPSQFDAQPKHVPESAAGGGSTTSTCSCCVITLLATNVLAARQLATLATKANTAATAVVTTESSVATTPATKASPKAWGALGFFIFPFAALVGFALSGGLSLGAPVFAVAIVIGAFCLAYDKLTNNPRRGALIAILFIAGASVGAVAEVFLWLGAVF
jgi:hypothetical protein